MTDKTDTQKTEVEAPPAEPAKYLVTVPPGAPIDGIGFVQAGKIFTAPSADYVPSRTFRAVNESAQLALEDVYDQLGEAAALRLKDAPGEKKPAIRAEIEQLGRDRDRALELFAQLEEKPQVEDGLTLAELGKLAGPKAAGAKADDRTL